MFGYTFFDKTFVLRWTGTAYADSFIVGWLLMLSLTLMMTVGLQMEIIRAKNLH